MGSVASSGAVDTPGLYRPRNARATPLYQLLESYYEDVKALWEERFERKYGYWRGFTDTVVARYLDCGGSGLRKIAVSNMWTRFDFAFLASVASSETAPRNHRRAG